MCVGESVGESEGGSSYRLLTGNLVLLTDMFLNNKSQSMSMRGGKGVRAYLKTGVGLALFIELCLDSGYSSVLKQRGQTRKQSVKDLGQLNTHGRR